MNNLIRSFTIGLATLFIALSFNPVLAGQNNKKSGSDNAINPTLDFNEQTHLEFMCQEEKLARDVYITLGLQYPEYSVFGNIDNSEQRHVDAATAMFMKYGFPNPSTNDNPGVFTSETYGRHFTENYKALIERGTISELEALYVGAFIEELDMRDINFCPLDIVDMDNGINDISECGRVYTDQPDILRLYGNLLEGSESHLRAYVKNIEKFIGEGNYEAQVLLQDQVDEILGR